MKRVWIAVVLLGFGMVCRAQTFAEWFEQNKTRKQYNEAQISALQTYIGYAEKGYAIVESGLQTIKGIKTGEFNLHSAFYSSLSAINPAIGKMGEVAEIVGLQAAMVVRFNMALSRYRQGAGLSAGEVDYIGKVYAAVLSDGLADINALIDLLTADKVKMTDDQRVDAIRVLDGTAKERYAFVTGFTEQADVLSGQRLAEGADAAVVLGLYGVR